MYTSEYLNSHHIWVAIIQIFTGNLVTLPIIIIRGADLILQRYKKPKREKNILM